MTNVNALFPQVFWDVADGLQLKLGNVGQEAVESLHQQRWSHLWHIRANGLADAGRVVHSDEHFHLIDEAVATGDREFVKLIHQRMQLRAYARFVARRPALLETLRTAVPDFYLEMKWDCACSGVLSPLVRAMGLSDTYHIWKRGSQLRIDGVRAFDAEWDYVRKAVETRELIVQARPRAQRLFRGRGRAALALDRALSSRKARAVAL